MDDILNKPLTEITEDPFFRAKPEHTLQVQKALKIMGYPTHTAEHDGKLYLAPGEIGNRQQKKKRDRER